MNLNATWLIRFVLISLLYTGFHISSLQAQMRVGAPTAPPDGSAALDVSSGPYNTGSPYRGINPPKVALVQTSQAAPIKAPITGLLVYNIAKVGDVIPGYYYWEGAKWVRFETSHAGSGRLAAGGGQAIQAYMFSDVQASTTLSADHILIVDPGREGLFQYVAGDTSTHDGAMVAVSAGQRRYKRVWDRLSLNPQWFGAIGNGTTDCYTAFTAAVKYAKAQTAGGGGSYVINIAIPAGFYYLQKTIDVTNANGIWFVAQGGSYINTGFIGNTLLNGSYGIIIDFSGSSYSGVRNLGFYSYQDFGATRSTIGVQFALSAAGGGLRCKVDNCYFQMHDNATANGGMGSIGVVMCGAEESSIEGSIAANIPVVLTNNVFLSSTGLGSFTLSSSATLATGQGSQGVTKVNGTLISYEKRKPALVLNGCNSVFGHLYIGVERTPNRSSGAFLGIEQTAILFKQSNYSSFIRGTIEGFSRVLKTDNLLYGADIEMANANATSPSTEILDFTGAQVRNSRINITLPNPGERSGAVLAYHAPMDSGDSPATGSLTNSEIGSPQIDNNFNAVSPNLLRQSNNVTFNTLQPFERKAGIIRQLFSNPKSSGTIASPTGVTVLNFKPANKATTSSQNGGFYLITVHGTVMTGSYASGTLAARSFTGTITMSQAQNSASGPIAISVAPHDLSSTNPAFQSISGVIISLDKNDPNSYKIIVTPAVSGSEGGEPVTVDASVEIKSSFRVNEVLIKG